jgi:hypothetical protein
MLGNKLIKDIFVFVESDFEKLYFNFFLYLFIIRKVGQRKTLSG